MACKGPWIWETLCIILSCCNCIHLSQWGSWVEDEKVIASLAWYETVWKMGKPICFVAVRGQTLGLNLGRVFNFRSGHLHIMHLLCSWWKTVYFRVENSTQRTFRLSPVNFQVPQSIKALTSKHFPFWFISRNIISSYLSETIYLYIL